VAATDVERVQPANWRASRGRVVSCGARRDGPQGFGVPREPAKSDDDLEEDDTSEPGVVNFSSVSPRDMPPATVPLDEADPRIADRMLSRILIFSGTPLFLTFVVPGIFYYLTKIRDPPMEIPTSTVYLVSALIFSQAIFGITYGIISTSSNPEDEGSLLGLKEFKENLPAVLAQLPFGNKDKN